MLIILKLNLIANKSSNNIDLQQKRLVEKFYSKKYSTGSSKQPQPQQQQQQRRNNPEFGQNRSSKLDKSTSRAAGTAAAAAIDRENECLLKVPTCI